MRGFFLGKTTTNEMRDYLTLHGDARIVITAVGIFSPRGSDMADAKIESRENLLQIVEQLQKDSEVSKAEIKRLNEALAALTETIKKLANERQGKK
jgi:hypothetical protein